jgi:hypothetical protein
MTPNKLQPLNLPHPVEVELDSEGLPQTVRSCTTAEGTAIDTIMEVWRIDDEWWRQPISRHYVEVVLQGGRHLVLYEDLVTGDWYMQKV